MSPQYTNARVLISKIPENTAPNKSHFRTEIISITAPELKDNELFVKTLVISLDPWIRHTFPEGSTEAPVVGYAIALVLNSKNPKFPVGAVVYGPGEWAEYNHISDPVHLADVNRYDEAITSSGLALSLFNGILGVPAFTVWHSLKKVADLKEGETIYISSAAGTLGQIAGQLAKRKGLRVIGSAGSQEKIDYLINELGFDAAFNYKTQDKKQALLAAAGPKGLDIYYDLVGDDTVDIALEILNPKGRVISVGTLNAHHNNPVALIRNAEQILWKQLRFEGYTVFENYELFPAFWKEIVPLVKSGALKFKEYVAEARPEDGELDLRVVSESYVDLLAGKHAGKVSVHVADL
ncbi:hypothetical protein BGZ52_002204 [Haplosporangium bisporale]|nr:hypothetical protein BGZ52_002204 [Haplosporangium bisporale]